MPRNGSGTYSLPAGNPVVTGTTISSTVQNNTMTDVATALTSSIAKDGQTTPTANLPMGTYRHTGVGNGVAATDYAALGQVQNSAFLLIGSISGADTITGTLTPTLTAYAAGQRFSFVSAGANTGAVTLNIDSLGAKSVTKLGTTALVAGDIPSGAVVQVQYDGTRFQMLGLSATYLAGTIASATTAVTQAANDNSTKVATTAYVETAVDAGGVLRGYIDGAILSTAGSSTTMSISAGEATDSTTAVIITLAASIAKTTSAWAVGTGNGGLDTGSIANSTWYYFYLIRRTDTGVVDVVFSTSASSPTLPTNYTQYRYIGAGFTNGSAQWTVINQDGDLFKWSIPILDVNATGAGTSAVTRTLSVPRKNVVALMNIRLTAGASGDACYISDLADSDQAPSSTAAPLSSIEPSGANASVAAQVQCRTNTSGQIRSRQAVGDGSCILRIATFGWIDQRGKNA